MNLILFSSKLYVEKHTDVSILYADVVNYTQMTTQLPVRTLVETLHSLFVKFDEASVVRIINEICFDMSAKLITRIPITIGI